MENNILSKNHFTLTVSTDINLICKPLEKYNVNFFAYVRCYDDGYVRALMSNKDIHYHHFEQEYLMAPYIPRNMLQNKFYYLASPNNANIKFNQAYYEYTSKYQLSHPMYIFERGNGYVDYFFFSLSQNKSDMLNIYINNMDFFESFKFYLKDKATNIIKKADKHCILLPEHMRLNFAGLTPNDDITKNLNLLKEHTNNINHLLKLHFNTKLTPRELQSLGYLLKGRTAAETAQALNISPKTVEFYIESTKIKLNCLTRADLFDKIFDTNLIKIITKI